MPSVTTLPLTPPDVTLAADCGVCAFLKVMVWPSMFSVEPSWTRLPSEPAVVCRLALTLALPAPVARVRPSAFRKSALPVTLRSAPVELFSVTTPLAAMDDAVWAVPTGGVPLVPLTEIVAAPALIAALLTPLARSIAVRTSLTEPVGAPVVPM
ncbi:hypothetical protein ACVWYH_007420 [Bradyrhizobium sp. GM24.11]